MRGWYVMGENPLMSEPNLHHAQHAVGQLEFFVAQDIFLNETAVYADVVLPAASFAEKDGTFTNSDRRAQRCRAAVPPPGQARPDWEIIVWPRGRQPGDATTPIVTAIPTLLISGGLDPVTPPAYAEQVAKTLSNHKHVIAPGHGHIVSPHARGPRLVAAFVDRAGFDPLPASCLEHFKTSKRPPLWPDRLAPAP